MISFNDGRYIWKYLQFASLQKALLAFNIFYSFQKMGQAGDGYQDNPTPHTVKEEFLGVNVNNATWVSMCPHANAIDLLFYYWSILIRWPEVRVLTLAFSGGRILASETSPVSSWFCRASLHHCVTCGFDRQTWTVYITPRKQIFSVYFLDKILFLKIISPMQRGGNET